MQLALHIAVRVLSHRSSHSLPHGLPRDVSPLVVELSLALFALVASCAHTPLPKPTPFAESAAFHATSGSIYGILERDLDQDGLAEAVVVNKTAHGYAAALFRQAPAASGTLWTRVCDGEVVLGTELEVLSFVEFDDGALALIAAQDENPDEQVEDFVLVDPMDGCTTRLKDRLQLPRPADLVLGPGTVPAGVVVTAGEAGFRLVDEPHMLHLTSADGNVDLLTGVRTRQVRGGHSAVEVHETSQSFLRPTPIAATWQGDGLEPVILDELVDGDSATGFSIRAGTTGRLVVDGAAPLSVVELVHGCYGAPLAPLEIAAEGGDPFITGVAAAAESFVAASGKSYTDPHGGRHELLALKAPTAQLALSFGPVEAERCIKELRAYGFVAAP